MRRDARLIEQRRSVGVDAAGDERRGHRARIGGQPGRHMRHRDRVKVGEEEEAVAALRGGIVLHPHPVADRAQIIRSEEHTSELQSLMRISYAAFSLKKKTE